ncbi:MAG: hypothetical protein IPP15_12790 [Saprospiraceae bacterium]|uniref:Uncharacterized protein n=1 Tax=Candidatus Opimibacter skivensis TaxID=2982028 RepID=A0A9D7SWH0_9BACT|nr:hypothetical protein [Candidatus Opimibacter skivensis]
MSIFSCFRKKENLQSWLDKKFPGQFEVVDSRRRFMEQFQFSKRVTSVVAFKQDTLIEFVVIWYRDVPDLRVSADEIQNAFDRSKKEAEQARALYKSYTEHGSAKVSMAVVEEAAYFLVYEEPSMENRKKYLQEILSTLDQKNDFAQTKVFIDFMEDSTYHQEFNDIVPAGFWNRIDHYYQDNKTVSIDFAWSPKMKPDTLVSKWTLNTYANRSSIYRNEAYQEALKWADKNIKPPYYIEPDQLVWDDLDEHDLMAMHFHFPYYTQKPPDETEDIESLRLGYVSGVYQADQKTFSKIVKGKEF